MSFFRRYLASSFQHRPFLTLAITAGLLACQASLGADVGGADSSDSSDAGGKTGKASRPDGTIDASQPVAFQMAVSGALDSSAPTVPGPQAGSGAVVAWRNARPKVPVPSATSSSSLSQVSLATVSDELVRSDVMFVLSRSVVPLLTPQSPSAGRTATTVDSNGDGVFGTPAVKKTFRSRVPIR